MLSEPDPGYPNALFYILRTAHQPILPTTRHYLSAPVPRPPASWPTDPRLCLRPALDRLLPSLRCHPRPDNHHPSSTATTWSPTSLSRPFPRHPSRRARHQIRLCHLHGDGNRATHPASSVQLRLPLRAGRGRLAAGARRRRMAVCHAQGAPG
ncbi:hypothetical protein N657DRAFT_356294 [Parathielavia appendiculata]|uniref:Uncharacterized protein n=1 Tax=Parathielavia appendiculata TaxID=2587402 RepID=A0AAN6U4V8_9PEZI|nr:hypothetical protein N657DRAFT_356294 [Parathielavia appendiculata]